MMTDSHTKRGSKPVATKSVSEVVAYLEHPKVVGEFHGSTLDGMLEVEFSEDKLEQMIHALSQSELSKLMEKVTLVCQHWTTLRVAPGNDIGTMARYQTANLIIGTLVNDLVATDPNATTGIADPPRSLNNPPHKP